MANPSPLAVAAVSALLLVVVLGADALMNRTYALDVRGEDGWKTFAEGGEREMPRAIYSQAPVEVEDNASVAFRLRVDNGYPWQLSETYEVRALGRVVAEGVLTAPARGVAVEEFVVDVAALAHPGYAPYPDRASGDHVFVEAWVGDELVASGEVFITEASA